MVIVCSFLLLQCGGGVMYAAHHHRATVFAFEREVKGRLVHLELDVRRHLLLLILYPEGRREGETSHLCTL